MYKYYRLFIHLVSFNFKLELEYRKNFIIRLFTQFLFVILQLVIVNTFFQYTTSIGTWSRAEVFLLVGIFRLVEGLFKMFFYSNMMNLPYLIHDGELDLLLTKPVNSQFYISFRQHLLFEFSTVLSGVLILIYTGLISGVEWISLIILSLVGLLALYSLVFSISTMSFYISRFGALHDIWDMTSKITRFPLDIFTSSSKQFAILISPLLLVATIPAQIFLAKVTWHGLAIQLLGSFALFFVAVSFWNFSLHSYSSASS